MKVLVQEKYLSDKECEYLIDQIEGSDVPLSNIKEGTMWHNRVKHIHPPDFLHDSLVKRRIDLIEKFFGIKTEEFKEKQILNIWRTGDMMNLHSDHAHNKYPNRDYASLIYLNDDYRGGELVIPQLDFMIRPKKGMMISFRGGDIMHGVSTITQGTRYTNSIWLKEIKE